ncbi:hypothetical protein ABEB36_013532 [Hypothenemus hampei]|uniref:RNA-directed DNA polymerase n=1 Tax=Hypothenemus hampei TaxID=57062 RepID=A0ABD1E5F6_HYPHA
MKKFHNDSSHPGLDKMLAAIKQDLYWKGMTKSVRKYVQNCRACITGKSHTGKRRGMCQQKQKPVQKLDTWHIDHAGPLVKSNGKTQILVAIDAFTKLVMLRAISQRTTACIIEALRQIFEEVGKPKRIIADRALAFTSVGFKDFLAIENIELHLVATGMPRGNGQVERVMRTLFNMLRATLTDKNEKCWVNELSRVEHDLNRLESNVTGVTPVFLMTGENERLRATKEFLTDIPVQKIDEEVIRHKIIERMQKQQHAMKARFNKTRKDIRELFSVGDHVAVEKSQLGGGKLSARYTGPFEVIANLENDRYALRRVNGQRRTTVAGHEQLRRWPPIVGK